MPQAVPLASESPRTTTLLWHHRVREPVLGFDEVILTVFADVVCTQSISPENLLPVGP
jgi:hypothetical protein